MDYYEKRASKVVLEAVLRLYGWKIYGYKEDMSDSMTDYYDPANWHGIAVKNGFILVVDNYSGGQIGGSFVRSSYDHKVMDKIRKLEALRDCPSASVGEKQNAQAMIESIMGKAKITEVVDSGLEEITYQRNPGNTKWHIEKNGDIIAKGTGVFCFGSLEYELARWKDKDRYYYTVSEQHNYDAGYSKQLDSTSIYGVSWSEHYPFEKWVEETLKDRTKQTVLMDKLFDLIAKWNALTTIKLGDGDEEEKLVKKTIVKTDKFYIAEISDTPTEYCKVNDGWKIGDLSNYDVFKISDDGRYVRKLTRDWTEFDDLKKSVHTFSLEPRKSTKPIYNPFTPERFVPKEGKKTPVAVYIRLVEKTKTYTEEAWVKEKPTATKAPRSKPEKQDGEDEKVQPEANVDFEGLIENADVVDFEHTQTKEVLKVLKIKEQLGKEKFIEFNKYLTKKGIAYYSKFAKGFVVKDLSLIQKEDAPTDVITAANNTVLSVDSELGGLFAAGGI